ncbi:GGDEF domain-containing protein [Paraburkholderia sp. ZP32-5]|uniref:GGDEF domain-containing protein n=1 Tax=Paraburkholderia sp. ZP32-5 TaxID=2883245 RepID=UPI001F2C459D|nr:GGDEF domain-containing protein [Paraburkholderia sp. ZP32-5]
MDQSVEVYTLPRGKLASWLLHAGKDVPLEVRVALAGSLFGTLPIFLGGVLNTVAVAWVLERRHPEMLFRIWLLVELVVCITRMFVLVTARRRARRGQSTLTDLYVLLAPVWGATVGYGAFVSVLSGDWVAATLSFLSAAAMVGGICFRNFGAPRLVAVMIFLSLGPCCLGALFAGERVMLLTLVQIPFYLFAMSAAAWRLNGLMVATMKAERENDRRARHDGLTGLLNRDGLFHAAKHGDGDFSRLQPGMALLFLDLDGFKPVNDAYGHDVGDQLLVRVARRLRVVAGPAALVARLGGDEFAIVTAPTPLKPPRELAGHIIDELGKPFELGTAASIRVGVSVGIAIVPAEGSEIDSVLRAADEAMYIAKRQGRAQRTLAPDLTAMAGNGANVSFAAGR